jgi:hypothetical protein
MTARLVAVAVLTAAFGSPGTVYAHSLQAPPTLTPFVARDVAATCPGSERYVDALVHGITLAEADAAAPILNRCATAIRLFDAQWKNRVAEVALAAVDLSRGLLRQDPSLLKRAADATRALRASSAASDGQIRSWDVIPDGFDAGTGEEIVYDPSIPRCSSPPIANAAYIYLAARSTSAWIQTPRPVLRVTGAIQSCRESALEWSDRPRDTFAPTPPAPPPDRDPPPFTRSQPPTP